MSTPSPRNSIVAIFSSHERAEQAVHELARSHFDLSHLSLAGRDYHSDEQVVGYYNTGGRMRYWGKQDVFWSGLWSLLSGAGFFLVPGIGPLLVAGPIVASLVGAIKSATLARDHSIVHATLNGLGIPAEHITRYEIAIKMGKMLLIYQGSAEQLENANHILQTARADTVLHIAEMPVAV